MRHRAKAGILRQIGLLMVCLLGSLHLLAQKGQYNEARTYLDARDFVKAAAAYKELRKQYPDNREVYNDYLFTLMALKEYKAAEALAKDEIARLGANPLFLIDMGNVYKADGKVKKAAEQFEAALKLMNGDDNQVQQMANALSNSGNEDYAIKVYERAISITQSPFLYSAPLARLYDKTGQTEQAIITTISGNQGMPQMRGEETVEATLLEIIGKDPEKARLAQKAIIRLINNAADNTYYSYLLIWAFSIQDNWDQALVQVQALERRSNDKGRLLADLAVNAGRKGQYEVADQALQTIIGYGKSNARYTVARETQLALKQKRIEEEVQATKEAIVELEQAYAAFFEEFPDAYGRTVLNDYARLEAQYAGNVSQAITLLNKAIQEPRGNKLFIGNTKLQLGDYYIVAGKVWEAALAYAQVDKAFREDALGEEARYRNAKLSYYHGDFEMAQGQLSVLKASTSELIANDALYLSVLITENTPDSNMLPLSRFAAADLLLFQNKDKEAETLLDSLTAAFPKHPLNDDILMLRSRMAVKHKDYQKAISWLKQIIEHYGKDVLADDALFRIAEIKRNYLKEPEDARHYYEQLIIDYPGSTYVQQARILLKEMSVVN